MQAKDHEILTVAVLLPEDQEQREKFYEHIGNHGELYGSHALASMHGNVLNFFKAQACLQQRPDFEACLQIYNRLSLENQHQIACALKNRYPNSPGEQSNFKKSKGVIIACLALAGVLAVFNCI